MQRKFKSILLTCSTLFFTNLPLYVLVQQQLCNCTTCFHQQNLFRFDLRAFRWTQVMIFAIEEINKDPALLPNISLGYRILDSCASPTNTLRAALTLASRPEEIELTSPCPPAISALIAESGSSQSLAVAGTLGPFQVPIVRK